LDLLGIALLVGSFLFYFFVNEFMLLAVKFLLIFYLNGGHCVVLSPLAVVTECCVYLPGLCVAVACRRCVPV